MYNLFYRLRQKQWVLLLLFAFVNAFHSTGAPPLGDVQKVSSQRKQVVYPDSYLFIKDSTANCSEMLQQYRSGKFVQKKAKIFNFDIAPSPVWLHFKLKSTTGGTHFIEINNSRLNQLSLCEVRQDTIINHRPTGDLQPFDQREITNKNFCFKIWLHAGESADYFIFVDQAGSTAKIPVWITPQKHFEKDHQKSILLDRLVYGGLMFTALFSILLFINTKHLFYLYYGLYIASGLFWFWAYWGLGFQFIWPGSTWFQMFAAPLFACVNLILNIKIVETLLVIRQRGSSFRRWNTYFQALLLCIILFPFFVDLRYAGYSTNAAYLQVFLSAVILSMTFLMFNIIYFITKRSLVAIFYLLASLIKAFGIINLALVELNLGINEFSTETSLQAGIILETIFLSYVIAKRYTAYKNKTTQSIISAQEKEREIIAKEIHDNILSGLNGVIKLSEGLLYNCMKERQEPHVIKNNIKKLIDSTTEVYCETRNISHYMMPEYIVKFNLSIIAETYIHHINETNKTNTNALYIDFSSRGAGYFSKTAKLNIFRILQELITNILKHAQAKYAVIHFDFLRRGLALDVADDGKGIDNANIDTGIGFLNITSRVRLLHGSIKIIKATMAAKDHAKPGGLGGARIKIFIPYYQKNYFDKNEY